MSERKLRKKTLNSLHEALRLDREAYINASNGLYGQIDSLLVDIPMQGENGHALRMGVVETAVLYQWHGLNNFRRGEDPFQDLPDDPEATVMLVATEPWTHEHPYNPKRHNGLRSIQVYRHPTGTFPGCFRVSAFNFDSARHRPEYHNFTLTPGVSVLPTYKRYLDERFSEETAARIEDLLAWQEILRSSIF